MTAWAIACFLYVIGGIGLYAMACDMNGGPIRTKWKRAMFIIWPIPVAVNILMDIFNSENDQRPNWLSYPKEDRL